MNKQAIKVLINLITMCKDLIAEITNESQTEEYFIYSISDIEDEVRALKDIYGIK